MLRAVDLSENSLPRARFTSSPPRSLERLNARERPDARTRMTDMSRKANPLNDVLPKYLNPTYSHEGTRKYYSDPLCERRLAEVRFSTKSGSIAASPEAS